MQRNIIKYGTVYIKLSKKKKTTFFLPFCTNKKRTSNYTVGGNVVIGCACVCMRVLDMFLCYLLKPKKGNFWYGENMCEKSEVFSSVRFFVLLIYFIFCKHTHVMCRADIYN